MYLSIDGQVDTALALIHSHCFHVNKRLACFLIGNRQFS
jgi:hypothetical protein